MISTQPAFYLHLSFCLSNRLTDFVHTARPFEISNYSIESLQDEITIARAVHDSAREMLAHHLMVTANGRYDFNNINLNPLVSVQPERFRDWLLRVWSSTT